jgi:hypothetical protein
MIIFLIWANVTRNLRRTILTILSIAVSIFIFAGLRMLPAALSVSALACWLDAL